MENFILGRSPFPPRGENPAPAPAGPRHATEAGGQPFDATAGRLVSAPGRAGNSFRLRP